MTIYGLAIYTPPHRRMSRAQQHGFSHNVGEPVADFEEKKNIFVLYTADIFSDSIVYVHRGIDIRG
jgi:hypothetical protein